MNRFQRIVSESHLPEEMRQIRSIFDQPILGVVGEPGVRDTEFPCEAFQYGKASGICQTDGHYMCRECREKDPNWNGWD